MNGFIFINKDRGWTSRDVCNKVSNIFNKAKVGHIGTLDPFATGLLIVMVGSATKTSFLFEDDKKEYIATLKLGKKTTSGDVDGEIIKEEPIRKYKEEEIKKVLGNFLGKYMQVPPMTSAVHVNGVKLYKLAHKGMEIPREVREVYIHEISLLSYKEDTIIFKALVSKGTYIRVLGEDIANKLGTVGYLSALERTRIDQHDLSNAVKVDEVSDMTIIPIEKVLNLETYEVSGPVVGKIKNGVTLSLNNVKSQDKILLKDKQNGDILAIYQFIGHHQYKCIRGLWN